MVGLAPEGKVAVMKLCISVGFAKVKVWLVLRVMNTLLELMFVVPSWARAALVAVVGVVVDGFVVDVVFVVVVGVGVVDLQTDGCPEQVYPLWIWQLMQPAE